MQVISHVFGAKAARLTERVLIYTALAAAFAMVIAVSFARAADKSNAVRIGFQKSSTLITVRAATSDNLSEQQQIADAFLAEGLLPKKVNATDVTIWQPGI